MDSVWDYKRKIIFFKNSMKIRKKAVELLSKKHKFTAKVAKKIENEAWKFGKQNHQRIIRLILQDKNLSAQQAYCKLTKKKMKVKIVEEDDIENYVKEGEVACFKCGNTRIRKTEMQTRSADEPATTFYKCIKCKARWKR